MSFKERFLKHLEKKKSTAIKIYPCNCFVDKDGFLQTICDKHRKEQGVFTLDELFDSYK